MTPFNQTAREIVEKHAETVSLMGDMSMDDEDAVTALTRAHLEGVVEELEQLKAQWPDPDDDSKFSPDGAGGWHVPSYQLAIADCIQDVDQLVTELKQQLAEIQQ